MIDKFYTFRVIIEPDRPSGYHGFVPLLRGVHTQGETIEEVKNNLKEALICHIQGLVKERCPIPQENNTLEFIETIPREELLCSA